MNLLTMFVLCCLPPAAAIGLYERFRGTLSFSQSAGAWLLGSSMGGAIFIISTGTVYDPLSQWLYVTYGLTGGKNAIVGLFTILIPGLTGAVILLRSKFKLV